MGAGLITGGLGAAASAAGGIMSGKDAKKAAEIQAQEAAANRALYQQMVNTYTGDISPYTTAGTNATTAQENWLGLNGAAGNGAQQQAFNNFQNADGYQYALGQGLNSINSNAYSNGLGDSGATAKALDTYGSNLANTYANQYYTDLSGLGSQGLDAYKSLADVMAAGTNGEANSNTQEGEAESAGLTVPTADEFSGLTDSLNAIQKLVGKANTASAASSYSNNPFAGAVTDA